MSISGLESGSDRSDADPAMSAQQGLETTGFADPRQVDDELALAARRARVKARMFGARVDSSEDDLSPPRLGRYLVIDRVGRGGMGTVFEAFDPTLDRRVAVKVLHRSLGSRRRLRLIREARALARLSHPNVVQVYEADEVDDQTFIAMELVRGQTLRAWLRQQSRPDWRACVEVFLQAGAGLAAAHAQGLVHRDFKPGNVVIDDDGRVRVLDFGLARDLGEAKEDEGSEPDVLEVPEVPGASLDAPLTHTGAVLGTPAYMALEQLQGLGAGASSDQFSFCVSLYEALYAQRPFEGDSIEALTRSLSEGRVRAAPAGPSVPEPLRRVLLTGLASDPAERWPSMDALLEQLRQRVAPPRRRRWLLPLSGLVLASSGLAMAQYQSAQQLADEKAALALAKDGEAERAAAQAARAADEAEALRREHGARASLLSRTPGRELEALALAVGAVGPVDEAPVPVEVVRGLSDSLGRARRVAVLPCAQYGMWTMAWSPDDTRLATTGWDGPIELRDGTTGEVRLTLEGHRGRVYDIVWTADGSRLATVDTNHTVGLWDARTGQRLSLVSGHDNWAIRASWSPDDSLLATASPDGTTRIWDGYTGEPRAVIQGHTGRLEGTAWASEGSHPGATLWDEDVHELLSVRTGTDGREGRPVVGLQWTPWSPEGTRLTTASYDAGVQLWHDETGEPLVELRGHTGAVSWVEWSPDDTRLAVLGDDGIPRLWDARTGESGAALHGHTEPIGRMQWATDGERLATTSKDGTARLWDGDTGEALATLAGHTAYVVGLRWSHDGTRLATTARDATTRLWDAHAGEALGILRGHSAEIMALAWEPDGARLATASWDGTARLWHGQTGEALTTFEGHEGPVVDLGWRPGRAELFTTGYDGTARRWNADTGETLATLGEGTDKLWTVATNPEGTVVTGGAGGAIMLWDGRGPQASAILVGHTDSVAALSWAPDGGMVASGGWDHVVRLWDGKTGEPRATLQGHQGWIVGVEWTFDGVRLASAGMDGTARIWDAASGESQATLQGHDDAVVAVAWRPDGSRLVTASKDRTARVWNAQTGEALAVLQGHTEALVAAAWSPDGTRLATAGEDGTAMLWDGRTGERLASYEGHEGAIKALAWSPDGTRLATAGADGTARLWPGSLRAQVDRACEVLVGSTGAIELSAEVRELCGA